MPLQLGDAHVFVGQFYPPSPLQRTLALEVKSGKDYTVHSALNRLIENKDYWMDEGFVLSNAGEFRKSGSITYLPIYYVMFTYTKRSSETDTAVLRNIMRVGIASAEIQHYRKCSD